MHSPDLYYQFRPLEEQLIRQYAVTPELGLALPGEIYNQLYRLVDSYDLECGTSLAAYVAAKLPRRIAGYVRDNWRTDGHCESLEQVVRQEAPRVGTPNEWEEWPVALRRAICALPHRQRLALVWRYYDAYSYSQIATNLAVSPLTVRMLLHYAITSLRTHTSQTRVEELARTVRTRAAAVQPGGRETQVASRPLRDQASAPRVVAVSMRRSAVRAQVTVSTLRVATNRLRDAVTR